MKAFLTGVLKGLCVIAATALMLLVLSSVVGTYLALAWVIRYHFGISMGVLVVAFLVCCGIDNFVHEGRFK